MRRQSCPRWKALGIRLDSDPLRPEIDRDENASRAPSMAVTALIKALRVASLSAMKRMSHLVLPNAWTSLRALFE